MAAWREGLATEADTHLRERADETLRVQGGCAQALAPPRVVVKSSHASSLVGKRSHSLEKSSASQRGEKNVAARGRVEGPALRGDHGVDGVRCASRRVRASLPVFLLF